MGKNTGKGYRIGAVKKRTQTYNDKTKKYIKRNTTNGQFMKSKDTPFVGVEKDKNVKKVMKTKK
jgi:hypothetical protein